MTAIAVISRYSGHSTAGQYMLSYTCVISNRIFHHFEKYRPFGKIVHATETDKTSHVISTNA